MSEFTNMTIDTQNEFIKLGKLHAIQEAKTEKKRKNVEEIEGIFYKSIPREHPVKFIKSLTFSDLKKIHDEDFDLFLKKDDKNQLIFENETKENELDEEYLEKFRKILIKIYWYINHKNNTINELEKNIKLEQDTQEEMNKNSSNLITELEELENEYEEYRKNNDFYKYYFYVFTIVFCIFFFQNFWTFFNVSSFTITSIVSILKFLTFGALHEVYIYSFIVISLVVYFLHQKNKKVEEKED
jgi:hypothetical protein